MRLKIADKVMAAYHNSHRWLVPSPVNNSTWLALVVRFLVAYNVHHASWSEVRARMSSCLTQDESVVHVLEWKPRMTSMGADFATMI